MPPRTLVESVDVYWVQGLNGNHEKLQVLAYPSLGIVFEDCVGRLFESGREIVTLEGIVYKKTLDAADMVDGKPIVHLRYDWVREKSND